MTIDIAGHRYVRWLVLSSLGLLACSETQRAALLGSDGALEGGAFGSTPAGEGTALATSTETGSRTSRTIVGKDPIPSRPTATAMVLGGLGDNCPIVANVSPEAVECKAGATAKDDRHGDAMVDSEEV